MTWHVAADSALSLKTHTQTPWQRANEYLYCTGSLQGSSTFNAFIRPCKRRTKIHTTDQETMKRLGGGGNFRYYFTNAKNVKKSDPYSVLGLEWGATLSEIKSRYRKLSLTYHPDRIQNGTDKKQSAMEEFVRITRAYQQLTNFEASQDVEDWRFKTWRQSDHIALQRKDVAGAARKRPIPPVSSNQIRLFGASLGGSRTTVSNEFLGEKAVKTSSSVGRGQSKWVSPKPYQPWKPTK